MKNEKLKIKNEGVLYYLNNIAKRYIHLTFVICYLSFAIATPAMAGVGASSGADFLRLGGGARPLGLGEAYVGLADDASSIFYNPAGLANLDFYQVMSMSNNWFAGINQQMGGVAIPTNFGVLAVGYSGIASGDIAGYSQTGEVTSIFSTNSSSISLSFGKRINPWLSFGVGVKTVSEKLENSSAAAAAFDLGLQYRVNRNLNLGFSVLNYGSGLQFVSADTPLPTSYRLGGAFSTEILGEDINIASDIVSYPEGISLNTGLEYLVRDSFVLRLGSSGGILRAGLGITANLLAIDYAYMTQEDLGTTHQLSLSLLFGAEQRSKKLILENMALGKAYLKEKEFADAILCFEKVMSLDSKNEEVSLLLRRVQVELENEALRAVFAEKEGEIKRDIKEILSSGKEFLKNGKYIEALAEFSKVLKIEPTHREALKLQNKAQFKMESQLIKKSKEEGRQYLGEAVKLAVIGKYKDAAKQIELALAKDPKNKEALALQKKLKFILSLE